MSLASQIESVQPDVYYKLLSEAWYQTIAVFKVREKRLDTRSTAPWRASQAATAKAAQTSKCSCPL